MSIRLNLINSIPSGSTPARAKAEKSSSKSGIQIIAKRDGNGKANGNVALSGLVDDLRDGEH